MHTVGACSPLIAAAASEQFLQIFDRWAHNDPSRRKAPATQRESSGTQAIERAVLLLTTISGRPQLGWRLTDLATTCDLSKATTHRILSTLVSLRLVRQRTANGRYYSGPLLYDLALALPECFQFQASCRPHLQNLATRTRTSVFLALRSGDHYVCIDQAGVGPLGLLTRAGTRRPLISAAMGNAILVALPQEMQDIIVAACILQARTVKDPFLAGYMKVYERSRACGYGLNISDVAGGVTSVSVPILNARGAPFASLSAIGETTALSNDRIQQVLPLLRDEANRVSQDCSALIEAIC